MRFARTYIVVLLLLMLAIPVLAQQIATTTTAQALTLLQNSLAALTGGKSMTDITLTGTAHHILSSEDESGTVTYKAIPNANRLDLSLSGGTRNEVTNSTTTTPAGSWSGPDGV